MKNKTAMHLMIDYLCSIGEYDIVDKANELLELEKQQIENAKAEGYNFATSEAIKEIQKYYSETFKKQNL